MALLIGYFLLSIVFSFLCSISEAVLLSVTPSFIKRKEQEGSSTGKLLAELKKDIDKPLSAILTLNTIAHTVGAIGVGAEAGKLYGTEEASLFGLSISYESIIAVIMTLGILFLSEIIPKTIGANNWQGLAGVTARSLKVLMLILKPFVWLSNQLTKLMKKDKERSVFSKQDFAAMAEVVSESGDLNQEDYQLIKNVLQFDDLSAKDVMTPRTVMKMAEETEDLQSFYENNFKGSNKPFQFSRIPLYKDSRDSVTGILLKDDLLQKLVEGKGDQPLSSICRKAVFIKQEMSLRTVFETLKEAHEHLAVVVDEYGALQGLVSLEDVFETLFGLEIMDETDQVSDLQAFARQKWEERARKMGLIE
ncbi:MAG: hemolysin family protein [Bacteroidota bacterium]